MGEQALPQGISIAERFSIPICMSGVQSLAGIWHHRFEVNLHLRSPNRVSHEAPAGFLSCKSLAGFRLFIPDTPGTEHDEDEEYVTLGVMALPRGTVRGFPAESHEDPISKSAHYQPQNDLTLRHVSEPHRTPRQIKLGALPLP